MIAKSKLGFWQRLQDALTFKQRPIAVTQVEVTSICPHACVYCPHTIWRQDWKSRHMPLDTFVRLWPLFRISDRVHLQGWGEPLAHPDFLTMVALAREAGCHVSTTTSGRHMDHDLAQALVQSGLDVLAFSLAGATAATNDLWRTGIAFEQVVSAIHLVQQVRQASMAVHMELHLAYLLLASHLGELQYLPELMQTLGIHATVISILDSTLAPGLSAECFAPHEQEKCGQARQVLEKIADQVYARGLEFYYALPEPEATGKCFEGAERGVFVDAEGNLAPCVHLNLPIKQKDKRSRVFGSSLTCDPVLVWQSLDFVRFRAALSTANPDEACLPCIKRFLTLARS